MDRERFLERINYQGDINNLMGEAAADYGLGEYKPNSASPLLSGIEDLNIVIETDQGKFVAKVFSKQRSEADIVRTAMVMQRAAEAEVHPRLFKTSKGSVVYKTGQTSLVLMSFIEGKTFFDEDRAPDKEELETIIKHAASINRIDYRPPYIFDSWAVPNINDMFAKTKEYIDPDDLGLVLQVLERYNSIPLNELPHAFVHGDFTKQNVIKRNDGQIYILDFSVANWYPRIQELAVIAANLMHDNGHTSLRDRCEVVAKEYDKLNSLSDLEKKYLYDYALAAVAMEFMGSVNEKQIVGNDISEIDYWMKLGREGLRRELG